MEPVKRQYQQQEADRGPRLMKKSSRKVTYERRVAVCCRSGSGEDHLRRALSPEETAPKMGIDADNTPSAARLGLVSWFRNAGFGWGCTGQLRAGG